uniref:DUF4042 domain-containing protein n=1 Tax=Brachypodium distachyon TaxID=15368 RepID=C3SAF1_BRADI|nr:hypothetical protein-5 [Brachypodium distachyon]
MASSSAAAASGGSGARPWRTALLTLRDESVASPSPPALLALLLRLLLSPSLPAAAAALSAHEVGSDLAFLAEKAAVVAPCAGADDVLRGVCRLIHDVMCRTNTEIDSSGWLAVLKFLDELVRCSIDGACVKGLSDRTAALNTLSECLQILRFLNKDFGRSSSLTENSNVLRVLILIISCLQAELNLTNKPNGSGISSHISGSTNNKNSNIWDMEISAFSMVEDILCKIAPSMSEDLWKSVLEILRKVIDLVTARNLIIESSVMSRFYTSFLRCLHLVLSEPKGSLSGHVAGFVANLQMFFVYGLRSSTPSAITPTENSDLSDTDGYATNGDRFRSSKARLAAILCIQDICRADSKSLTSLWPLLLPENDVLQQRKHRATLMTCLIFDPITKVRVEAASTIAVMLEGHALVLTQVAEYKESSKLGSFTTLSCSLGQILMQLHTGVMYLIQHETLATFLAALFRVLILLISATPYSRMPKELLPTVITAMCSRLLEKHSNKNEHYALVVLRSVVHNYPSCADIIWEKVQDIVLDLLQTEIFEDQRSDANFGPPKEELSIKGRCLVAGIKVIDECLRVSSGFKGADDLKECRLLDIQQISDCTVNKSIKSAPHFEIVIPGPTQNCASDITLGTNRWIEVIETLLPRGLSHASAMVRTASLTCFAGMTSDVFFSLPVNNRDYVTSSSVHAAMSDAVATVRSAACRAIGIVSCFSQILSSSSLPGEFIEAIEFNTRNSSTPVRITASWALANLCSSIRFRALELQADPSAGVIDKSTTSLLVEIALRLTKDGEKVKSNAVRALGYLSRFIRFNHQPDVDVPSLQFCDFHNSDSVNYGDLVWLERMVQALMSCVTTGNVKVQWNVCHALSNLFMNDTLRLSDMPWASSVYSILLLLLRDSNNYKIRMHAAVALAVPVTRLDYGTSFPDVVRGPVHVLESLSSNNASSPSNFKHRDNLEKQASIDDTYTDIIYTKTCFAASLKLFSFLQLTFTALHLLGFVSPKDDQSLKDFLFKKATFLEDWLKSLCSSFNNTEDQPPVSKTINDEDGFSPNVSQKVMLSSAVMSLLEVYKSGNQQAIAQRFEHLARSIA